MADVSASYAYNNVLQATTREAVLGDVVFDQFFQGDKFMMYLLQNDMVRYIKGGAAITWVNNFSKSPNSIAFEGADNLPINSLAGTVGHRPGRQRGFGRSDPRDGRSAVGHYPHVDAQLDGAGRRNKYAVDLTARL
jgi:hypothetical protein